MHKRAIGIAAAAYASPVAVLVVPVAFAGPDRDGHDRLLRVARHPLTDSRLGETFNH